MANNSHNTRVVITDRQQGMLDVVQALDDIAIKLVGLDEHQLAWSVDLVAIKIHNHVTQTLAEPAP